MRLPYKSLEKQKIEVTVTERPEKFGIHEAVAGSFRSRKILGNIKNRQK